MKSYVLEQNWWQKIMSYFKGYPTWLVEFGLAATIGFVVGFLVKNFGKYLFFIAVTLLVAAYVLNYFSLATFHIAQIQKFLGIAEVPAFDQAMSSLLVWARINIPICTGGIIGFLLGWRIGQ